ncbi:MAG: UxaA family hydrolase, partial [Campylobacteraceae bacterium]|nr:UxaA family hydrolase [Campylobacteraceae bacterium]
MKKNDLLLQVNANDNVGIVLVSQSAGSSVDFYGDTIKILNDASVGDRIALSNMKKNDGIYQYSSRFATASRDISCGEVITGEITVDFTKEIETLDLNSYCTQDINPNIINGFDQAFKEKTFLGYKRSDGNVGTRNYYIIIPTSFCATDIAVKLSYEFDTPDALSQYKNIDGVVSAGHTEGCGCGSGDIIDRLLKIIKNTISHPNCGGALIVDLGCEKTNYNVMNKYLGDLNEFNKPIDFITIQELGGTTNTLEKGRSIISKRLQSVNNIQREACSLSTLVLGTECGASDSFSGITANPLIGAISDNLIDLHAKVILSETPEMLGAEEILLNRMPTLQTRKKFINGVLYYKNI